MRHAHSRGRAAGVGAAAIVATAIVAALAGAAGGFVVADGDRPAHAAPASSPAPRVTVTAAPEPAPITAPSLAALSNDVPQVAVSPRFDMDAHPLDDPTSPWVVVNKARPIDPLRFEPAQTESVGGALLTPDAAAALTTMRAAATDAGVPFGVSTGFRSHGFQAGLYRDYVAQWGADRADRWSARPGYSEHQTGLAVDVYQSSACRLQACFGSEPAGRWVAEHGHEYGFIVRYQEGDEEITGYRYEPWHLRYVGVELATEMREQGVSTIEEFFGLDPAPDYP